MRDLIWGSSLSAGRKLILLYLLDNGAADAARHTTSTMLHNATQMSRPGAYSHLMWLVSQNILTRHRVTIPGKRGPRYAYQINVDALPWHGRAPTPARQISRTREERAAA